MLRNAIAVIIGLIAGTALYMGIGGGALIAPLARSFAGGWVAARIGSRPILLAVIVGGISTVGGFMLLVSRGSLPGWMQMEAMFGFTVLPFHLLVAGLAGWLCKNSKTRRAARANPAPAPAGTGKAESNENQNET